MSFQWPVDTKDLFDERNPQMVNTGLPAQDVDAVHSAITEMWLDTPGGWVYEWTALAARYAAQGRHQLASLAYGWAKFPTLASSSSICLPHRISGWTSSGGYSRCRIGVPAHRFRCTSSARPDWRQLHRCCSPLAGWTAGRWTCTPFLCWRR